MNNDENNWNTDNNANTSNNDGTWNTNNSNNTDNVDDNKGTWDTNNNGTTTNNDTWNTNNNNNNTTNTTSNNNVSNNTDNIEVSTKNRMTALMLCWFLGLFGVHRLYAGKLGTGFLFLYGTICAVLLLGVCAPIGCMWLITMVALVANDFAFIAFGQFKDCYGKTICSDKLQ